MFETFWTSSYRNLKFTAPIEWQSGINFVFGDCGAGKTNLCRALKDIFLECELYTENQENLFCYSFRHKEVEIFYAYTRRKDGEVERTCIQIPQYEFNYSSNMRLIRPIDIFREISTISAQEKIKSICNLCYADNYYFVIPDDFKDESVFEYNKDNGRISYNYLNNRLQGGLILDDAELIGEEGLHYILTNFADDRQQAIVVIRRSEWLDRAYGKIENYYYMQDGEIKKAVECSYKYIKSVKQLKNLFLKGVFS